jgi:hypothetical protein
MYGDTPILRASNSVPRFRGFPDVPQFPHRHDACMAGEELAGQKSPGKDSEMFEMTPTAMTVRTMRFQDDVAQAERYHALVRGDKVVGKTRVAFPAIRLPRISPISRLFHKRLRPA